MALRVGAINKASVNLDVIRENRVETAFVAGILVLAALLMPVRTVSLGDAAANNLSYGLSLLERGEPLFLHRGPVYYGLIALSFKVFGVSIEHAVWVTRMFIPLNIALVYVVARTMLNRTVAMVAALLVFFSWPLNMMAARLEVDNVLPFFMLLALWLTWLSVKKQSTGLAIAAGFTLGIAWLTKETAMMFLPIFALALVLPEYRTRRTVILGGLSLAAFAVALLPWALYVASTGSSPMLLLGGAQPSIISRGQADDSTYIGLIIRYLAVNGPQNLARFFLNYFRPNFALWLPLVLGLGYAFVEAYRRRSLPLVYLAGGIVFFSVIAVYQAERGARFGQNFILYLLLYILLAFAVREAVQFLPRRFTLPGWLAVNRVLGVAVGLLLVLQFLNPLNGFHKSSMGLWAFSNPRSTVVRDVMSVLPVSRLTSTVTGLGFPEFYIDKWEAAVNGDPGEPRFVIGQRFDADVEEAAVWMTGNIPDGTRLLVSGTILQSMDFFTRFRYPIASYGSTITYKTAFDDGVSLDDRRRGELYTSFAKIARRIPLPDGAASEVVDPGRLLGIATYDAFRQDNLPRFRMINLHFEGLLLDKINVTASGYIVIFRPLSEEERGAKLFSMYDTYLRRHPQMSTAFENERVAIFKIESLPIYPSPDDSPVMRNPSFYDDLEWLKEKHGEDWEKVVQTLERMNISLSGG